MNEQLFNMKLVKEVEKRPFLYNYKLPQYSQKKVVKKGWTEVGKVLNLTESHAKEKWRNLRTVFSRHLKTRSNGSEKKTYYLADAMQFAIPYIKKAKPAPCDNFSKTSPKVSKPSTIDSNKAKRAPCDNFPKTTLKESKPFATDEEDDSLQSLLSPMESFQPCPSNSSSPGPTLLSQEQKPRFSFSEVDHNFIECQFKKKENMETPRNAREMFLLSLLPELEAMDQFQMNTFKRRVLALIDDIVYTS